MIAVEFSRREVHIELLGAFSVRVDGTPVDAREWRLRKARTVVAMLALAPGQRRHREQVLERLWPALQPVAAARNLHQTLYVARRALAGPAGRADGLLAIKDELIVLDEAGPVPVDVLRFEKLVPGALVTGDEAALRSAAQAYSGDLLPDLASADWLTARREDLREAHRAVLVRLASAVADRTPDESMLLLSRVLESDPLHEGAVRALMTLLCGRRPPIGGTGPVRAAGCRPAGGVRHGPRPADHGGVPRTTDRRAARTAAARTRRPAGEQYR